MRAIKHFSALDTSPPAPFAPMPPVKSTNSNSSSIVPRHIPVPSSSSMHHDHNTTNTAAAGGSSSAAMVHSTTEYLSIATIDDLPYLDAISCSPSAPHSSGGGDGSSIASVLWQVVCGETKPGDTLAVVGSHPILGNWNPKNGIALRTDASLFPTWVSPDVQVTFRRSLDFPPTCGDYDTGDANKSVFIEYKFIIMDSSGGNVIWEPLGGNHNVTVKSQYRCLIETFWGEEVGTVMYTASRPALSECGSPAVNSQPVPVTNSQQSREDPTSVPGINSNSNNIRDRFRESYMNYPHPVDSGDYSAAWQPQVYTYHTPSSTSRNDHHFVGAAVHHARSAERAAADHHRSSTAMGGNTYDDHSAIMNNHRGEEVNSRAASGHIRRGAFIIANTVPIKSLYDEEQIIGRGTWGEVKVVVEKSTSAVRAAKKIPKCFVEDVDRFLQEIDIMKSLDHPNIVRLHETFEDGTNIYLVMEHCSGGELFDRLVDEGNFSEHLVCKVMKQVLAAVGYCHSLHVAHRDLKPENFLFLKSDPDSPLKLIDFGLASRFTSGTPMRSRAGTPYYVSPQVLEGRYGPECDVWSAGVIMYILLCGYPPFNAHSDRGIMAKVKTSEFQFPDAEWQHISVEARDLIKKLLERHPKTRITAEHALKHSWFATQLPKSTPAAQIKSIDLLSKFRRFQGLSRLKKIVLTVIAQHLDEQQIQGLKDIFLELDSSGDGVLSIDEIREGVSKNSNVKLPADFDRMVAEIDTSHTGSIAYTEFLAACLHQSHYIQEEACRAAFRVFDIDGNGRISGQELKTVFMMAGDYDVDVDMELAEADLDGDGEICFDEFVQLMRRVPSRALLGIAPEESVTMMQRVSSRSNMVDEQARLEANKMH
eukprot:Lankesteria_metandrocarpae@DN5475_c3_g1_i11.p1